MVMGIENRRAELIHDVAGFHEGEFSSDIQNLSQVLSVDIFIDDIGKSLIGTDIEHLDDVLMGKTGRRSGFPFETGKVDLIGRCLGAHHLDGYIPIGDQIMGTINNRHAPCAGCLHDFVSIIDDFVVSCDFVHIFQLS